MIDGLYRRPPRSGLIRFLALACLVAIAWLSLYPLTDWRLRQPSMFAFLSHGLPRFHTPGDLFANVAAYLVFGMLATLGWFSNRRAWLVPVLVVLVGCLTSLTMESLQSWLPNRVPSILDVIGNATGVVLGAALGCGIALYRRQGALAPGPVSVAWYEQGPATGWILVVIWLVAQLPVQRLLFSSGHLPEALTAGLPSLQDWVAAAAGIASPEALRSSLESVTIAVLVAGLGVLVMDLVRHASARFFWIGGLLVAAYGFRGLAGGQASTAVPALSWLTSGAQAGLVIGALALYLIGAFRRRTRAVLGLVLVLTGILLVNLSPADPYFQIMSGSLRPAFSPAMTPSLRSLLALFNTLWPLACAGYFLTRVLVLPAAPARVPG